MYRPQRLVVLLVKVSEATRDSVLSNEKKHPDISCKISLKCEVSRQQTCITVCHLYILNLEATDSHYHGMFPLDMK